MKHRSEAQPKGPVFIAPARAAKPRALIACTKCLAVAGPVCESKCVPLRLGKGQQKI